jgi:subtilase family serine protease
MPRLLGLAFAAVALTLAVAVGASSGAATPLDAGMIALWDQEAQKEGLPRPGFVPPPLYWIHTQTPSDFRDITVGTNQVFGNVSCCSAAKGFDLASGLGSPLADEIAKNLHH